MAMAMAMATRRAGRSFARQRTSLCRPAGFALGLFILSFSVGFFFWFFAEVLLVLGCLLLAVLFGQFRLKDRIWLVIYLTQSH